MIDKSEPTLQSLTAQDRQAIETVQRQRDITQRFMKLREATYNNAILAVEACRMWAEPDGREGARELTERERDIYLNALDMAVIAIETVRGPEVSK